MVHLTTMVAASAAATGGTATGTAAATKRILRGGTKQLHRFFQQESHRFAQAPILLIQSSNQQPSTSTTSSTKLASSITETCKYTEFLVTQRLGWRAVVNHVPSGTFPTLQDVHEAQMLASRVGASTVIGVGSGAAIDIAKAVTMATTENENGNLDNHTDTDTNSPFEELVLVPATLGATMISSSSHALVIDPHEETIVPIRRNPLLLPTIAVPTASISSSSSSSSKALSSEQQQIQQQQRYEYYACLTGIGFVLDTILQRQYGDDFEDHITTTSNHQQETVSLLSELITCAAAKATTTTTTTSSSSPSSPYDLMLRVGQGHMCYGLGDSANDYGTTDDDDRMRSIPLALTASLLPEIFADQDPITFMASFVPSILHLLLKESASSPSSNNDDKGDASYNANLQQELYRLRDLVQQGDAVPPKTITNESLSKLISIIETNALVWNCYDPIHALIQQVLKEHVLIVDE